VTIIDPLLNGSEDAFRYEQHPVNVAVDWFWTRIAPDAKDTSVGGWDSHRNDLVSGKLTAQGLPRGVDTLVKEARLVDFDTCIVDRASGDRQGDALQQREVDPGRSTAAPGVRRNDP
jgi:hypothetical protein